MTILIYSGQHPQSKFGGFFPRLWIYYTMAGSDLFIRTTAGPGRAPVSDRAQHCLQPDEESSWSHPLEPSHHHEGDFPNQWGIWTTIHGGTRERNHILTMAHETWGVWTSGGASWTRPLGADWRLSSGPLSPAPALECPPCSWSARPGDSLELEAMAAMTNDKWRKSNSKPFPMLP